MTDRFWRVRACSIVLACACACGVFALAASSATAFGIANYALTPSSTQAAGHPNVTFAFDRSGTETEDLRDIQIDLPPGLLANPESANPKCTDAQFNSDTCPANSQVGSLSYKYTVEGSFDVTVPGNFYMLDPAATDTATVGFVLRPQRYCIFFVCAVPQKIFQKTSFKLQSFDNPSISIQNKGAERSITTAIPLIFVTPTFTSNVTIKSVKITAQARSGATQAGPYFMANTPSCTPAVSTATITSYQNVSASATSSFTPTNCAGVPFDPTFEFTPSDTSGGVTSQVLFALNVPSADAPIQNAYPKALDITFPAGSAPDFTELGKWAAKPTCSDANLQANTCPPDSIVGLASATSAFLPPNLGGGVYITGPVGLTIPLGIRLVGARGAAVIVRLTLGIRTNAAGTTDVYATFDNGPQLPYSRFALALIPLYVNPQQCGPATTNVKATGWNGAVVNRTTTYNVTNCKPPVTTITGGPSGPTTVTTPTFTFTSSIPGTTFKCKIDAQPEQDCNSGSFTTPPLATGSHTFAVYGTNGTAVESPAKTRTFSVEIPSASINATFTLSTLQAAAHPDLSTVVTTSGNPSIRAVTLGFPDGFQASVAAKPLCASGTAALGNCAAASRIGSAQVTALLGGSSVSGVGDVYLTDGPTASDAGGISIKVPLGSNTLILQGGQFTVKNTNAQQLQVRNIPQTLGGSALSITRMQVDLTGSGSPALLTNASRCSTASAFTMSATAADGSISNTISSPYQATGCASVPFAPSVTQSFPAALQAAQQTGITVDVDLPANNGTLSSLLVLEPSGFSPNFPAFGSSADQCPSSSAPLPTSIFDASACPAAAKVGKMTITTPLLVAPLVGDVYLINKSPLPWFGVRFRIPGVTLDLIGVTATPQTDPTCDPQTDPNGFCQTQISTRFSNLPDTPLTHVKFDLTAPDRPGANGTLSSKLLVVAGPGDATCVPTMTGGWTATSWTGASRSGTQAIPVTGC